MSARKIAYNTIAQVAGKLIGFFISSFFLIILANSLGTVGMGYYTTVTAFVGFFVNLADLGINTVMMREIAQNPEDRVTITSEFLGFRIVLSAIVMALAMPVAWLFPQYHGYVVVGVAIAALAQFFLLINQTFVSVLQVSLQLDRAVLAEIVNRSVTLGLVVLAARFTHTVHDFFFAVLWITVIAAMVNMAISYYFARKWWPIIPTFHAHRWKPIFFLVLPMGVFSFLALVHFKSDTIILSLLKPAYDVGIYGYAYKIGEIMQSIPMMFIGIVFPQLSFLLKNDKLKFLELTQKSFSVLLFVTLPFIGGIYLLAPYLTTLLSRQSVADGLIAGSVLRILCLAMFAWFFGALYENILLAGRSYSGLIRNISIAVILNMGLNFFIIPHFSYYGAAWTTVTTGMLELVLMAIYAAYTLDFRAKFTGLFPILVGTGAMAIITIALERVFHMPVETFAISSRLHQLLFLILVSLSGVVAYGAALMLWGKSSPLYGFVDMLKQRKSA